jgi:D-glycero-alpha-D-manno-heptose-7-phosphate kinase
MIITRTPFRISFFGGGTDFPLHYREHGGAVLNTTINKYCYITCRRLPPFFDHSYRIRYGKTEMASHVKDIVHPSVRSCLEFLNFQDGIEMVHTGDIPAMSGIGSSSSFTVGFLHALYGLRGRMVTKRKLAFDAIHVEQNIIGENVGSQDQCAAAFGGMNRIDFGGTEEVLVRPVTIGPRTLDYLQSCLLLYFTGISRYSSEIAAEQIQNIPGKSTELRRMSEFVDEGIALLNGSTKSIAAFGKLMHEAWKYKRSLSSKISNSAIDDIYERALGAGALGGKVCGAGGGGFVLLFVLPQHQLAVKKALKNLLLVPFRFDNLGSHVVFYANEWEQQHCGPTPFVEDEPHE